MINLRVFECFKSVCLISGLHVITSDLSILYVKHISHKYIYISETIYRIWEPSFHIVSIKCVSVKNAQFIHLATAVNVGTYVELSLDTN